MVLFLSTDPAITGIIAALVQVGFLIITTESLPQFGLTCFSPGLFLLANLGEQVYRSRNRTILTVLARLDQILTKSKLIVGAIGIATICCGRKYRGRIRMPAPH